MNKEIETAKANLLQAISTYSRCPEDSMTPKRSDLFDNLLKVIDTLIYVSKAEGIETGISMVKVGMEIDRLEKGKV